MSEEQKCSVENCDQLARVFCPDCTKGACLSCTHPCLGNSCIATFSEAKKYTEEDLARAVYNEREACARLAEHCVHSCATEDHCEALHAAHNQLASDIRGRE